jgi:hypothetical protein
MGTGYTGEQIYQNFRNGQGTGGMEAVAEMLVQLRRSYTERAQAIKKIQQRMEAAWTGDAGTAASAGAGPLGNALIESADNMDRTFDSVNRQAQAWHKASNSVEPVPPKPEKPGFWDNVTSLGGAQDTYLQKSVEHMVAAERNVQVMSEYEAQTSSNQEFPRSYTTLSSVGGSITIDTGPSSSSVGTGTSSIPDVRSGPAGPSVTTGSAPPSTSNVPPMGRPPVAPTPPTPGPVAPTPAPVATGPVGPVPAGNGGTRDPKRPTTSRPVTGRSMGERAGSRLYRQPGGGSTPTSGGAGARLGEGGGAKSGQLGAGRVSGTGPMGGPGGGPAAAAGGAAGARGGAGMAPMGAGGGRGQGDEDKEHQRASYLQENDPDEAFIGDLGKTAPPVIGQ